MSQQANPWLMAHYQPTSFFTLKPASATSSGGKTLLCPTPFSLKMALLDVAIRLYGVERGATLFSDIRTLKIALRVPVKAVVNNTFIKIFRPHKGGKAKDTSGSGLMEPMGNTIAFREYVSFHGEMYLVFQGMPAEELIPLLLNLNYLGKRGGFFQLQELPTTQDWSDNELKPNGYTLITEPTTTFSVNGLLQMLDDCGPKMTFDQVNIYNSGKGSTIRLGMGKKDRQLHHVVLPYRLVRSSKGYSYYERIEDSR